MTTQTTEGESGPEPPAGAAYRNRIKALVWLTADQIAPAPKNPRLHPAAQKRALAGVLEELGVLDAVLVWQRPDGLYELLDGHLRTETLGNQTIPALVLDVESEAEARRIIATFDRVGELAEWHAETLQEVLSAAGPLGGLKHAQVWDDAVFDLAAGKPAAKPAPPVVPQGAAAVTTTPALAVNMNAVFAAPNDWDMPELLPDMLYDGIPQRVWTKPGDPSRDSIFVWGKANESIDTTGGVLAFYVEDHKFDWIYGDPTKLIQKRQFTEYAAVIAPDFSMWRDDPLPQKLWACYRNRWLARTFQEVGVRIVPNLAWSDQRSWDYCFDGIPKGAPVCAVQCRTMRDEEGKDFFFAGLHEAVRRVEPQAVLLYGGAEHLPDIKTKLPAGPKYVYYFSYPALISGRKKRVESRAHHPEILQKP